MLNAHTVIFVVVDNIRFFCFLFIQMEKYFFTHNYIYYYYFYQTMNVTRVFLFEKRLNIDFVSNYGIFFCSLKGSQFKAV